MTNRIVLRDGLAYVQRGERLESATPGECAKEIERLRAGLERLRDACIESNDLIYAAMATEALSQSSQDEPS